MSSRTAPADPPRFGTSRLTVLSGPSGVGKSTVVAALLRDHPHVWLSVSVTTRHPRAGEVEGVAYHFLDDRRFEEMVSSGQLLEHADFAGHRYGTPREPVERHLAAGEPVLLEIELAGARQVRDVLPDATFVFLEPPSWEVLVERLTRRGTDDPDGVERRLARAREELAAAGEFGVVIANATVQDAVDALVALPSLCT